MVEVHIDQTGTTGRLILTPNRSWSWRANLYILYTLIGVSLTISFGFLLVGAWVILPWALLELSFLGACIYYVVRRCYQQEVITLSEHEVLIERGFKEPSQRWNYHRLWAQFLIKEANHPWDPAMICIRSHGEELEIGQFLSKSDKSDLIVHLKRLVYS